jgi:hypothetical protein
MNSEPAGPDVHAGRLDVDDHRPGVRQPLQPDQREFAQVQWWTVAGLRHADPDRFEPHLLRALDALGLGR